MTNLHRPRPVRDILAQSKRQPGDKLVLDDANDAWLDLDGRVSERNAPHHYIADVSGLHGAARVSAALAALSAYRASA